MSILDLSKGKILGQPEITEGIFILNIKCTCGQVTMLAGLPGAMRECANPQCEFVYAITDCPQMTPNGPAWKIGYRRIPHDQRQAMAEGALKL